MTDVSSNRLLHRPPAAVTPVLRRPQHRAHGPAQHQHQRRRRLRRPAADVPQVGRRAQLGRSEAGAVEVHGPASRAATGRQQRVTRLTMHKSASSFPPPWPLTFFLPASSPFSSPPWPQPSPFLFEAFFLFFFSLQSPRVQIPPRACLSRLDTEHPKNENMKNSQITHVATLDENCVIEPWWSKRPPTPSHAFLCTTHQRRTRAVRRVRAVTNTGSNSHSVEPQRAAEMGEICCRTRTSILVVVAPPLDEAVAQEAMSHMDRRHSFLRLPFSFAISRHV